MSLKGKFKSSASLVEQGVWFDVCKNSDGTQCRVRLRRHGRGNKHWITAFRDLTANRDMDNITVEEDEAITAEVFVSACVIDWEHFQPEDDGNSVPFSKETALSILSDPDWIDLLKDWQAKANTLSAFQEKQDKKKVAEAGN